MKPAVLCLLYRTYSTAKFLECCEVESSSSQVKRYDMQALWSPKNFLQIWDLGTFHMDGDRMDGMQGCGSSPFSAGSGSYWHLPTYQESIQTSTFFHINQISSGF